MKTSYKSLLTTWFARKIVKHIKKRAQHVIQTNTVLSTYLDHYTKTSHSTGCEYEDYALLYQWIKKHKPKEVLECGTGLSTIVIFQALRENREKFGVEGHLVSMEENEFYYKMAVDSMPPDLLKDKSHLEIILSPTAEDGYELFRGVRYKSIPKRPYDLVFIDGPNHKIGNSFIVDLDFIKLVDESTKPMTAFIDKRLNTCFVYSHLFPNNFRYDIFREVGIVFSVTKHDISDTTKIAKTSFKRNLFRKPPIQMLLSGDY